MEQTPHSWERAGCVAIYSMIFLLSCSENHLEQRLYPTAKPLRAVPVWPKNAAPEREPPGLVIRVCVF